MKIPRASTPIINVDPLPILLQPVASDLAGAFQGKGDLFRFVDIDGINHDTNVDEDKMIDGGRGRNP